MPSIEEQVAALTSSVEQIGTQIANTANAGPYDIARAEFMTPGTYGDERGRIAPTTEYQTSPTGKVLYTNGVIADVTTGQLIAGPWMTDPDVAGSAAWLRAIQDEWSDAQANKWRKTLSAQGYEIADSGGMAHDLLEALRNYHQLRYLNYGKSQPLAPKAGNKAAIRESFDPVQLTEEVKAWGQVPFEEDLDEDTSAYFADRVMHLATKLAKNNPTWSMERVQAGAQIRAQKEFIKEPGVKGALRDQEEDEMDETLRSDIVSIAQLGSVR